MRLELRITAAGYAARYEAAPKPHIPKFPPNYRLPDLKTVASCDEGLIQITHDLASGILTADIAEVARKMVDTIRQSLEPTEVRAEIAALKQFIDQVEAQRVIEHIPNAPSPDPE